MKKIMLLFVLFWAIQNMTAQSNFVGHWTGFISYKNSSWPLRLNVQNPNGNLSVFLDLPSLIYAGQEINAHQSNDSLKLEMPFGLGRHIFIISGSELYSTHSTFQIRMKKDKSPPYQIQEVEWESGHAILHGHLYLPRTDGPHSLMIRLHGSATGGIHSWEYRSWADYFARKGLAVLIYDRRGEGKSEGHQSEATFNQLADDLLSLIDEIKNKRKISVDKVIIGGGSQACYVAFIAQQKSKDIDYLLLNSCSSVEVIEQEYHALKSKMKKDERDAKEIQEAIAYQQLYFHYVRTGRNWEALAEEIERAGDKPWAKYIDMPRSAEDLNWWRRTFLQFRPEEHLTSLQIPSLFFYGEEDTVTPPHVMIPKLKHYFGQNNFRDFEIYLFPNVGHNLELNIGQDQWGRFQWPEKYPEMLNTIDEWFEKYHILSH